MGKIFFASDMEVSTLKAISEAPDCADIANDLFKIQETIMHGTDEEAGLLDCRLRQKYPGIITMLHFCDSLPRQPFRYSTTTSLNESPNKARLRQDYYGILCDAAIKKGIKKSISDCIDYVEGP